MIVVSNRQQRKWGGLESWLGKPAAILLGTAIFAVLMEMPLLDPTRGNRNHTGMVLLAIWAVALLSWALRVTRSHESRFTVKTLLVIMTVIAIGFMNVFLAIIIVGYAMARDYGVKNGRAAASTSWRAMQMLAGTSAIAHALRVMLHA